MADRFLRGFAAGQVNVKPRWWSGPSAPWICQHQGSVLDRAANRADLVHRPARGRQPCRLTRPTSARCPPARRRTDDAAQRFTPGKPTRPATVARADRRRPLEPCFITGCWCGRPNQTSLLARLQDSTSRPARAQRHQALATVAVVSSVCSKLPPRWSARHSDGSFAPRVRAAAHVFLRGEFVVGASPA